MMCTSGTSTGLTAMPRPAQTAMMTILNTEYEDKNRLLVFFNLLVHLDFYKFFDPHIARLVSGHCFYKPAFG